MLRYHIVFGIFLILSIINLALTAPVLVQEEHQANVDVVDIPKDVITNRGEGDIAKLAEEYLTTWENPIESSDTHTSSGTAPDPASSTTNPDSSCSPSMQGLGARGNCFRRPKVPPVPSPYRSTTNSFDLWLHGGRTPGTSWDYRMPWD